MATEAKIKKVRAQAEQTVCHAASIAMDAVNGVSFQLHLEGYHVFSAVLANFRTDVEKAMGRAIDALEEK